MYYHFDYVGGPRSYKWLNTVPITTPAAVEKWVREHCAKYERLRFHTDLVPFVDTDRGVVAGPWWAETAPGGPRAPGECRGPCMTGAYLGFRRLWRPAGRC